MTTYRNHVLALAARWKLGSDDAAARVLAMLPDDRREQAEAALLKACALSDEDRTKRLESRNQREERRLMQWGRRRYGAAMWDRLDPRVRKRLVQTHGRNH